MFINQNKSVMNSLTPEWQQYCTSKNPGPTEMPPPQVFPPDAPPETMVVEDDVAMPATTSSSQAEILRDFQKVLKGECDRILALHPQAHIALLREATQANLDENAVALGNARERDAEWSVLKALGLLDPLAWQAHAEKMKKELQLVFPKVARQGDTHCYAQFATFPPKATRGTVHVSQLAFLVEPPLGALSDAVRSEVGSLVSGDIGKTIQVGQPPRSHVKLDAQTFGWGADGAAVNGVRLLGRALVAFAIKALGRPIPEPWTGKWSAQFNAATVKFQSYGNDQSRLISMWKESMIAWKQNDKPTPITMAKSLVKFDIVGDGNVDQLCKNYANQMKIVDPSLQPQGNHMQRMKNFLNQARLPPSNWAILENYWAEVRYSEGAFFDKHFDDPSFWVGSIGVVNMNEFYQKVAKVTPSSQKSHIHLYINQAEQGSKYTSELAKVVNGACALFHSFIHIVSSAR